MAWRDAHDVPVISVDPLKVGAVGRGAPLAFGGGIAALADTRRGGGVPNGRAECPAHGQSGAEKGDRYWMTRKP